MGSEFADQVVSFITSILAVLPQPVLIGLVLVVVAIFLGVEAAAKKKREEAARAASKAKRAPRSKPAEKTEGE